MVPIIPLHVEKGSSFDNTLNWWGGGKFVAEIENIVTGYPTVITVTGHGLNTIGTPAPMVISGVNALDEDGNPREMRNINSTFRRIPLATYIDANTFSVDEATTSEIWANGTGEIGHWLHSDITGWGGECNIRKNWHSPIIHTISTQLGTMTLDGADGSCRIQIASNVTDTLSIVQGWYDIDLWPGGGAKPTDGSTITRVFKGPVYFNRDM